LVQKRRLSTYFRDTGRKNLDSKFRLKKFNKFQNKRNKDKKGKKLSPKKRIEERLKVMWKQKTLKGFVMENIKREFLLKKQQMTVRFFNKSFLKKLLRYQYFRGHYFKKRVLQFKLPRCFSLRVLVSAQLKVKRSFFDILKKK